MGTYFDSRETYAYVERNTVELTRQGGMHSAYMSWLGKMPRQGELPTGDVMPVNYCSYMINSLNMLSARCSQCLQVGRLAGRVRPATRRLIAIRATIRSTNRFWSASGRP